MTNARVMVPLKITSAMLGAGTSIPEPNTAGGEVAWVSAGTYVVGDERVSNGSIWICRTAHTGSTVLPEADGTNWLRLGPSARMAAFDDYTSTSATATGTLTYVINAGFAGAIRVYTPKGDACTITVRALPSRDVVKSQTFDLFAQAAGLYELLYTPLLSVEQVGMDDLPILPSVEITITVTASGGGPVSIGDIKIGDWRSLVGDSRVAGVGYGASAERKSYTYKNYAQDGTYTIVKRSSARNVSCTVTLEGDQAAYVDAVLGEIIDTAVPFEASDIPRYGYLNTLGFVSGSLSPLDYGTAMLSLKIEGNI